MFYSKDYLKEYDKYDFMLIIYNKFNKDKLNITNKSNLINAIQNII